MNIVMKREDIIAKLKARLPMARAYDAEQRKAHKAAEKTALDQFRQELRAALKLSYVEAKAKYSGYREGVTIDTPKCPRSLEVRIKGCISQLEMDQRQKITVDEKGHTAELHFCLTFDPDNINDVIC